VSRDHFQHGRPLVHKFHVARNPGASWKSSQDAVCEACLTSVAGVAADGVRFHQLSRPPDCAKKTLDFRPQSRLYIFERRTNHRRRISLSISEPDARERMAHRQVGNFREQP
jgi:hypothetical protein